jgi:hypothetical protein
MTLILTIQTRGSIWLVADRRLSAPGMLPIDDAIKATRVYAADGVAILGYAGLGATARRNQPSQWVSDVLSGRRNLKLEEILSVVANAMRREFRPHMEGAKNNLLRQHSFIVPAFVNDRPRIYTIDMARIDERWLFRYTRHTMGSTVASLQVTPPIALGGSGVAALLRIDPWKRHLLRLMKAYHRKRICGQTVAKYLAQLAYQSHQGTQDGTVGPDCLVVWQNSKQSKLRGGGDFAFFSRGAHIGVGSIPTIDDGMDMVAMVKTFKEDLMRYFEAVFSAQERGEKPPNMVFSEEAKQRLSKLPLKPDEKLR